MQEFDINAFVDKLKEYIVFSPYFPIMYEGETYLSKWGYEQTDSEKHPNRSPQHLWKAAKECFEQTTTKGEDIITFDLGSAKMEQMHPYYHILEDAPVIRKAYRGTKKTKGSQATIKEVGKRDYGRVSWNGKIFSKEYERNVRGSRDRTTSVSHWGRDSKGNDIMINREALSYKNEHYHYIENSLDNYAIERLAEDFGLKVMRKKDTGLAEEYALQQELDQLLEMQESFE